MADGTTVEIHVYVLGKFGGLNGSTQHSSRTRLALKTKAKPLARVRSAGTLPWLGSDRGQPNKSFLLGKLVESTHWMVLHRPFEPTPLISTLPIISEFAEALQFHRRVHLGARSPQRPALLVLTVRQASLIHTVATIVVTSQETEHFVFFRENVADWRRSTIEETSRCSFGRGGVNDRAEDDRADSSTTRELTTRHQRSGSESS